MTRIVVMLLALATYATSAQAQVATTPRTETSLTADMASVTPSKPFWALLHIKLKDGWHTYWKNPGDSGTAPILAWTLPNGFTAGEIQYQPPERLPSGPLMDYGYNNDAYYLIPITAPQMMNPNATVIIMLKAQWLVCKDTCVPEKADLSVVLPMTKADTDAQPSGDAPLITGLVKSLPQPLAQSASFKEENGNITFSINLPKALSNPKSVQLFPATDGIITNNAEQSFSLNGDMLSITVKEGENKTLTEGEGLISIVTAEGEHLDYGVMLKKSGTPVAVSGVKPVQSDTIPLNPTTAPKLDGGFLSAILLALLGGLVLNLMPCVLPILSLKVLSVAKKAKSHKTEVRKQALAYTAGVVISFMLLAVLLISLQKILGQSLGWGFQMQSPVFVALLSILMLLVGLNLSGVFELPVLFGNVGAEKASKDNAMGSFLTGVLAVMVATPCSAPFMAPAVGFALTQSALVVIIVFAALGVGLAAPFLLLGFVPALAAFLPKPGLWMLTLRQFLAFPIYFTVVWLLWVLANESGANGAGIAMIAMVLAGFCIFLFQRRESKALRLFGMVVAVATLYGVLHFIEPMMKPKEGSSSENSEAFSTAKLESLRASHTAVFVDATADWCITCKVNEALALSKPEVTEAFKNKKITKLVADWTNGDMAITAYLKSFERSGVPIYVYYPADGSAPKVLPQILTPSIVLEAIK